MPCDLTGTLACTIASDGCCFSEAEPGSADPFVTGGLSAERLRGGVARVAAEDASGGAAEEGARAGGGSANGGAAGGAAGNRARDAAGDAGSDAAGHTVENSSGNVGGFGSVGNGKSGIPRVAAGPRGRGSEAEQGHNSIMLVLCCAAAAAVACNAAAVFEAGV